MPTDGERELDWRLGVFGNSRGELALRLLLAEFLLVKCARLDAEYLDDAALMPGEEEDVNMARLEKKKIEPDVRHVSGWGASFENYLRCL